MYLIPYFLKRQNFFLGFSVLIAVRYLISLAFAMLFSLRFFVFVTYTTSLSGIVPDGVFIEFCNHVTQYLLVTQQLNLQSFIEGGWRNKFHYPVNTSGFFLDGIRQ